MLTLLFDQTVNVDTLLTDVLVDGSIRASHRLRIEVEVLGANPVSTSVLHAADDDLYIPDYGASQTLDSLASGAKLDIDWKPYSGAFLKLQATAAGGVSSTRFRVWAVSDKPYDFAS